jgi:hypothetical protein
MSGVSSRGRARQRDIRIGRLCEIDVGLDSCRCQRVLEWMTLHWRVHIYKLQVSRRPSKMSTAAQTRARVGSTGTGRDPLVIRDDDIDIDVHVHDRRRLGGQRARGR